MESKQVWAGVGVGAVLALLIFGSGRLGYSVPVTGAQAQGAVSQAPVPEVQPLAPVPGQEHAAFEWPAGVEYKLTDIGIEAYKASLEPLWTWDGLVGTYVDGETKVKLVIQGENVTGVEIITNASAIKDACLEAQLLYGVSVDGTGVSAACTGMWTKEWAEAQTGAGQ
jgi:hypothetical protein